MTRIFLILVSFWFLLSSCANQSNNLNREPASFRRVPTKADAFCGTLKKREPRAGLTLRHLRQAMTESKVIPNGTGLGSYAKDAEQAFTEAGFTNLLAKNPDLLKDPSQIKDGSIYLLRQAGKCRRVSRRLGHVAAQCGGSMTLVQKGFPRVRQAEFRDCIYAVMLHPQFDRSPSNEIDPGNASSEESSQ